jgi:hypothetical protein
VAQKLVEMNPQYPAVTAAMREEIAEARRILESEPDAPKLPAAAAAEETQGKGKKSKKADKQGESKREANKASNGTPPSSDPMLVSIVVAPNEPLPVTPGDQPNDKSNDKSGEKEAKKKHKKDKKDK